jgi:FkbM family methyltransferase
MYGAADFRDQFRWCRRTEQYAQARVRTSLKFLRWAFYQVLRRDFTFRTGGFRFVSMPGNWSSLAIYIQSQRDPCLQRFIERSLAPGSTFVDVGANIGTYTILASSVVGPSGKVVAIEPHPFIFGYLQRNITVNRLQNVFAVEVAVGAEPQTALMQYSEKNPGETHVTSQIHGKATQVPMARLDDVLSDLGVVTVDYLKIDVEGYELAVLRGAKRVIDASPNIIIQTELINAYAERYGHAAAEAAELLLSMAFSPHEVDRLGVPHVVSKDKLPANHDTLWSRRKL